MSGNSKAVVRRLVEEMDKGKDGCQLVDCFHAPLVAQRHFPVRL